MKPATDFTFFVVYKNYGEVKKIENKVIQAVNRPLCVDMTKH